MEGLRIQAFNSCVDDFLSDLVNTFPTDYSFVIAQGLVNTLRKTLNSREAIQYFWNYVKDYKTEIESEDESFFLTPEILETVSSAYKMLFEQIKSVWLRPNTSLQTKSAIFKHVKHLLIIAGMVCDMS